MHLQVRVKIPRSSPPSVAKLLALLAEAEVNLSGAGGSNVEFNGEFAFAPTDGQEDRAREVLDSARPPYRYRVFEVDVNPELKRCWLTDEPGQLLACIQETEQENLAANRSIRDILIGVPTDRGIPVQIFSETALSDAEWGDD
jgi:hypothetical protein